MGFELGDRVTLRNLVGNVRYIGNTSFADGTWIGIELDEELGKNDGSVKGKRYFTLSDKKIGMYGLFGRPDGIKKVSPNLKLASSQPERFYRFQIVKG